MGDIRHLLEAVLVQHERQTVSLSEEIQNLRSRLNSLNGEKEEVVGDSNLQLGDSLTAKTHGSHAFRLAIVLKPGDVGISADGSSGRVTDVVLGAQADRQGAQVGMTIVSVQGAPYTKERLEAAIAGEDNYPVTLTEDRGFNGKLPQPVGDSAFARKISALRVLADEDSAMDAPRSTARKSVLRETYGDGDEDKFKKRGSLFGDMGTDRDQLDKLEYDVCSFYYQTGYCQRIARSETFQNITLSVIGLNAVYIGVDADNNTATNLADADIGFQVCEHLFACFFTFEWVVRLCAFEYKRNCLKDNWFKFDTCLVWLMIGETWIMTILGGVDLGIPLGFIKMLRLLRLARMARLMRAFPELVAMMKGVKAASRAVGSALLMLVFNVYIFAIIMHMIYGGTAMERGLVIVMWDLLMDGTFVNGIGPYTRNLIDLEMHFGIAIFMVFVLLSAMTVMNMLIGVLCQVVSAVAAVEQENNAIQLVKTTLLVMLKTLDDNGNGLISKDELQQMVEHPEALEVLHSLDLDPKDLVEHLDMHYELEASDDPQLHINKIIDVILLMRGERPPNMKDLVNEQNFNRWKISKMLKDHPR